MVNLIQDGEVFEYTAPSGGVAGGAVVVSGSLVGVANFTVLEGEVVTVNREGVYELAKAAVAFTQGDHLFFDTTNKVITNVTAAAHVYIGKAWVAATDAATTGQVVLLPTSNSQGAISTVNVTASGTVAAATVTASGTATAANVTATTKVTTPALFLAPGATPASAGATGVANEVRQDGSYIYVCTATNTWKRAAIATW